MYYAIHTILVFHFLLWNGRRIGLERKQRIGKEGWFREICMDGWVDGWMGGWVYERDGLIWI
jgi:hypothetical protein